MLPKYIPVYEEENPEKNQLWESRDEEYYGIQWRYNSIKVEKEIKDECIISFDYEVTSDPNSRLSSKKDIQNFEYYLGQCLQNILLDSVDMSDKKKKSLLEKFKGLWTKK